MAKANSWLASPFIRHDQLIGHCLLQSVSTSGQWMKKLPHEKDRSLNYAVGPSADDVGPDGHNCKNTNERMDVLLWQIAKDSGTNSLLIQYQEPKWPKTSLPGSPLPSQWRHINNNFNIVCSSLPTSQSLSLPLSPPFCLSLCLSPPPPPPPCVCVSLSVSSPSLRKQSAVLSPLLPKVLVQFKLKHSKSCCTCDL